MQSGHQVSGLNVKVKKTKEDNMTNKTIEVIRIGKPELKKAGRTEQNAFFSALLSRIVALPKSDEALCVQKA